MIQAEHDIEQSNEVKSSLPPELIFRAVARDGIFEVVSWRSGTQALP
jgi:hypothetical protein